MYVSTLIWSRYKFYCVNICTFVLQFSFSCGDLACYLRAASRSWVDRRVHRGCRYRHEAGMPGQTRYMHVAGQKEVKLVEDSRVAKEESERFRRRGSGMSKGRRRPWAGRPGPGGRAWEDESERTCR